MEIALLRDGSPGSRPVGLPEAGHPLPEPRVLARGILDVLRILSGDAPLVLAVDDAQWLDRPSAGVLEFCLRRLQGEPVSILLTFRDDSGLFPLGLGRALPPDRLVRVQLGPLSLGAIGEILRSRLGAELPRYALTRLYDVSGGNPFYALECARTLLDHPQLSLTSEPIPIPRRLSDLVRRRMRQLTPDVRRVGQLVAASCDPRERLIRAACDDHESWAAIDLAVDVGLIERDGGALRFTHPLLRSVLYGEMPLDERRQVHQRLGAAAEDIEERAWHLALGADRPSEKIAGMLDDAARHAASRGAPEEAAAFAEQAARLTPAGRSESARERIMRAADYHFRAGDMARSRELIDSTVALGQAPGIFGHLGAPPWPEKASRELSKIAVPAPTDVLTETERHVAALVAQGHTNREVAAAMFVTQNTVQTHLRHIFQKLGVRSRTELAARLLSALATT